MISLQKNEGARENVLNKFSSFSREKKGKKTWNFVSKRRENFHHI